MHEPLKKVTLVLILEHASRQNDNFLLSTYMDPFLFRPGYKARALYIKVQVIDPKRRGAGDGGSDSDSHEQLSPRSRPKIGRILPPSTGSLPPNLSRGARRAAERAAAEAAAEQESPAPAWPNGIPTAASAAFVPGAGPPPDSAPPPPAEVRDPSAPHKGNLTMSISDAAKREDSALKAMGVRRSDVQDKKKAMLAQLTRQLQV